MLAAAGVGAYLALDGSLPRERVVTIVIGSRAGSLRELELSWTNPREPASDAALTTRWTFQKGSAPRRLRTDIKLPDGVWDAVLSATSDGDAPIEHRTQRVTLSATSWWKRDTLTPPLVLSLDEAPR
jgi:hypothetical protein